MIDTRIRNPFFGAVKKGREARNCGLPESTCPYSVETLQGKRKGSIERWRLAWLEGFHSDRSLEELLIWSTVGSLTLQQKPVTEPVQLVA